MQPGTAHTARVQARTRATDKPSLVMTLIKRFIMGPTDFVMAGQVLCGIKRRAERAAKTNPQPTA